MNITPAASGAAPADMPNIVKIVEEFVEEYEMRGEDAEGRDCDYSPNENEKCLILDAIWGLLEHDEFKAALASPQVAPALTDAPSNEWMDGEDIGVTKKQLDGLIDGAARPNPAPAAWRYKPSKVLAGTVLTDDPEMFKLASEHGCDIEPLYLAAPVQVAPNKVYLVATGEVVDGLETYTRHEGVPPPLCDSELLYATPIQAPAAADDARDAAERDLLSQALVSLESATSFLPKKARNGQPRLVAAIRNFLSAPAAKPAPNQWQRYYDALNELERVSEESTGPAAKPAEVDCSACMGTGESNYLCEGWPEKPTRCEKCGGTGKVAAKPAEPTLPTQGDAK